MENIFNETDQFGRLEWTMKILHTIGRKYRHAIACRLVYNETIYHSNRKDLHLDHLQAHSKESLRSQFPDLSLQQFQIHQ